MRMDQDTAIAITRGYFTTTDSSLRRQCEENLDAAVGVLRDGNLPLGGKTHGEQASEHLAAMPRVMWRGMEGRH